jgi:DNA modification methylase
MSEPREFLGGKVVLYHGDCLAVLPTLPENSVDAVCVDPPYHLASIVKRFSRSTEDDVYRNAELRKAFNQGASPFGRQARGFMGKVWDGGDIAFQPSTWEHVLRVLKPGGHLVAFAAPKNCHLLACAIEAAGFEIRDRLIELVAADTAVQNFLASLSDEQADAFLRCLDESSFVGELMWVFGTGFPKSHDISKGIDRALGAERERIPVAEQIAWQRGIGNRRPYMDDPDHSTVSKEPASEQAAAWSGWGTGLKPAYEPIILARKPVSEGSIAENVLKHGTGAINLDGCRIGYEEDCRLLRGGSYGGNRRSQRGESIFGNGGSNAPDYGEVPEGRWPSNLLHDGSEEVVSAFPAETGVSQGGRASKVGMHKFRGHEKPIDEGVSPGYGDAGSAARYFAAFPNGRDGEASGSKRYADEGATDFSMLPGVRRDAVPADRLFYTTKADDDDRLGSKHPTVKPLNLIQYLVRLICPKGGIVLDCFAGTGTTGEAAWREGTSAILIEREPEYVADIERRMSLALAGPDERARASIKQKLKGKPVDHGPLWAGLEGETHG